jgi:hypothetical protein
MTDNLARIVEVNVRIESSPLSPAGFGRAMLLAQHTNFPERFRSYTSLAGMLADGFSTSDQVYRDAQALLGQVENTGRRVRDFVVGRRLAPVAQVDNVTITFHADTDYVVTVRAAGIPETSVTVNGVTDIDDTVAAIVAALNGNAAIASVCTAAPGGAGSGIFTLTADIAGLALAVVVSASGGTGTITRAAGTPNVGIAEDLTAILATPGADFYAILPTSRARHDIVQAAAWAQTASRPVLVLAQSSDAALLSGAYDPTSIYSDVGSELKGLGYGRVALYYHATATEGLHAAIAGAVLPFDPGVIDWNHKRLAGITPNALTATEQQRLLGTPLAPTSGKNVGTYLPLTAQASATQGGRLASGLKIEARRVGDWLWSETRTGIANLLLSSPRVPFTDGGIQQVAARVLSPLKVAEDRGIIFPGYTVTAPEAASVSSQNRQDGVLPEITATATLTGSLDYAQVQLTLGQ